MPIVNIHLLEGRSQEQIKKMTKEVTDAISRTADVPKERIHIIVEEMNPTRYSVGGVLKSDEQSK